jgi:hypothetical protein
MSADFVPFVHTLNSRLASGGQGTAFSPLPSAAASPNAASPQHTHGARGEVKVELKREGDRITQIRIQCRCGELIELDCDYT